MKQAKFEVALNESVCEISAQCPSGELDAWCEDPGLRFEGCTYDRSYSADCLEQIEGLECDEWFLVFADACLSVCLAEPVTIPLVGIEALTFECDDGVLLFEAATSEGFTAENSIVQLTNAGWPPTTERHPVAFSNNAFRLELTTGVAAPDVELGESTVFPCGLFPPAGEEMNGYIEVRNENGDVSDCVLFGDYDYYFGGPWSSDVDGFWCRYLESDWQ